MYLPASANAPYSGEVAANASARRRVFRSMNPPSLGNTCSQGNRITVVASARGLDRASSPGVYSGQTYGGHAVCASRLVILPVSRVRYQLPQFFHFVP